MITTELKAKVIEEAKRALLYPYPKDTKTVYASAVLTDQGKVFGAASYFSDTFSLTLHGEQAALAHAAAHGEGNITALVSISNQPVEKGEFVYPCHMCKQLCYESSRRSNLPMLIIMVNCHDEVKEVNLSDMISYPWP